MKNTLMPDEIKEFDKNLIRMYEILAAFNCTKDMREEDYDKRIPKPQQKEMNNLGERLSHLVNMMHNRGMTPDEVSKYIDERIVIALKENDLPDDFIYL